MALLFEICFYIGLLVFLGGLLWLLRRLLRGEMRAALFPIVMMLIGAALVAGPSVISRNMAVNLGPREKIVDQQRVITLTGWDRGQAGYQLLREKRDTVVLQMGNVDVDDKTLDLLAGMTQLIDLDLNDSNVTDVGLAKLAQLPSLSQLRLRGTKITDAGFREHLLPLTGLKNIDLRQTMVLPETIEEWKSMDSERRAFR